MHTIIIVTSISVFIIMLVLFVILCKLLKSRQKSKETETVDDNFYYGHDDFDEEYQGSAITDQNDYYAL